MTGAEIVAQVGLGVFGVPAALLSQLKADKYRRWAAPIAMCGQPFWFYSTWAAGQYVTLFLCVLYTLSWSLGLWNFWIQPWLDEIDRAMSGLYDCASKTCLCANCSDRRATVKKILKETAP